MRSKLLIGAVGLLLVRAVHGQTADAYINDGLINCPPQNPPQIDATNFVNNNFFNVNFTNIYLTLPLFDTSNTRNFTNRGQMLANTGFRLDNSPANSGQRRMADTIYNPGFISAGSILGSFGTYIGGSKLFLSATNIIESGTNVVGVDGLLQLTGKNIDLTRGALRMEGYDSGNLSRVGIFDQYWGLGTNTFFPATFFQQDQVFTPVHQVTSLINKLYFTTFQSLSIFHPQVYVNLSVQGTNLFIQVAYVGNTNASIGDRVFFAGGGSYDIGVEWSFSSTNSFTGVVTTNYLNLLDSFGVRTNFSLTTNAFTGLFTVTAQPTAVPANYNLFQGQFFGGQTPAGPGNVAGLFGGVATNEYTAYSALLQPTTQLTNNVVGQEVTNLPGRVEITADNVLNLNRTRIDALNYLMLRATNHFIDSVRSSIIAPFADVNFASTNGFLTISNLVSPTVPRFTGDLECWSGRWTNAGLGLIYHVLVVDSHFDVHGPAYVQDLKLRSTNVIISDQINIARSLLVDGETLTTTTNIDLPTSPRGDLNILSESIVWSSATPRLKRLTNNGAIRAMNAMYFGGARTSAYFGTNYDEPYLSMINRGEITNQGTLIWANQFENSGLLSSGIGSISMRSVDAGLTNGSFIAANGDVTITANNLVVTNHVLKAGRAISLTVTNLLTDTGTNDANFWSTGTGISLYQKPVSGDLRGTTISNTLTPFFEGVITWAGINRGCTPAGYTNNAAVGRLILDGGDESLFTFAAANGTNNAIYVDYLELRNFITNRAGGQFIGLQVNPGMKVYFAQAIANGVSIASKLDGLSGGRFCWVSDYAGFYSATNVVYPDGTTNLINSALVQNQDLDSDGDGLANGSDTTPLFLITTPSLADATNGTPYTTPLQAFGGPSGTYTWSLAGGSLPAGLNLSADGVISGTPTVAGTNSFTARASVPTSGGTLTTDHNYSLIVQPAQVVVSLNLGNQPPAGARVSWVTTAGATNYVYYRSTPNSGAWQLLTNFVSQTSGKISISDPVGTNKARYYRVQMKTQ